MKRILIVDDEPLILEMLAKHLETTGYYVATATSGKIALQIMIERDFDILLSDIMMPEMSGFELAEMVKKNFPDTSTILMTGFDLADNMLDYPLLRKPFRNTELTNVLSIHQNEAKYIIE